ncbi:MAG: type II toxin-antitoxin system VapC family toxin [Candidatus Competibacter sp.]|nr:type II toxin-antitoxin system VapC family toxin [Candidatus Competibacter sp.]
MKIVDLNVLLYAVNADSAHHRLMLEWWNRAVNQESLGLPWVVLLGFLRISTHPKIFPVPLTPEIALQKVGAWLALDNVRVVHEQEQHWELLRALLEETGAAGNLTTDAHLAALAIGHGAVLVSCDNDFMRFKGLRWENPLGHSTQ